jgi:RNA polymerase sigma-70 factor (ECF subfamily)
MTLTREQFDRELPVALPILRNVVRKMVGHREQSEDVVQDALQKAWEKRSSFESRARFSTWLCSIGVRSALDLLRSQKRWRVRAQIAYSNECRADESLAMEVGAALYEPSFTYDAKEHIAYCFACVGRSLEPDEQAALVLSHVIGLSNAEGARALGLSESVFRHHLSAARQTMTEAFDGLCALVTREGVCHQCRVLREATPEGQRGDWPQELDAPLTFERRLPIVQGASLDNGRSQVLHDLFFRRTEELEQTGRGDVTDSACTPD